VTGGPQFNFGNPVVNSVVVQSDGKVLLGGNFTNVHGTSRNGIARLQADGSLDLDGGFNPGTGTDHVVASLALQPDSNVLLGGHFTTVNGMVRPYIARLYGDSLARPQLDIQRVGSNVVLSWSTNAAGFRLQSVTNLAAASNWGNVNGTPSTIGSRFYLTNSASSARMFYRLMFP
jgi:hypothetical protein